MNKPHRLFISEEGLHLLLTGIEVAKSALDRFERPTRSWKKPPKVWKAKGVQISTQLASTKLRARGSCLEVSYVCSTDSFRIEIREFDRDLKSPVLTISEHFPLDRRPTACDPEEIEATLSRWIQLITKAEYLINNDEHEAGKKLIGAMVLNAKGSYAIHQDQTVHLPSIYRSGAFYPPSDFSQKYGGDAHEPIASILENDGRERIMANMHTIGITSQWWNYGSLKKQRRVLFDLSAVITAKVDIPGPMESLRILSQ